MNWAEVTFSSAFFPPGGTTTLVGSYYQRDFPRVNSFMALDGNNNMVVSLPGLVRPAIAGSVKDLLPLATSAGY